MEGRTIPVYGDGRQSRGNTEVRDCVDGTVRALLRGKTGAIYNLGGGTEVALLDVVRVLERVTGRVARLAFLPRRIGDQRRTLADTSRARDELDWEPRVGIAEGLTRQVAWIRGLLELGLLPGLNEDAGLGEAVLKVPTGTGGAAAREITIQGGW
jgi:nucleoside-diphosphate-sugar epimerase